MESLSLFEGTADDRLRQALKGSIMFPATGYSTQSDLWAQYLAEWGYTTGTLQERICAFMNSQLSPDGTTYNDTQFRFWNQDDVPPFPGMLTVFDFRNKMTALPPALQAMGATYTRNSEKRVVQDGALVTLAANQFGTSYDPVTGLYGYVPEPAATNLATNSDGAASTYTNRSNVADGSAVPGFTNGIAYGDASLNRFAYKPLSVTSGTVYSVSVFVIMDDGGAPIVGATSTTGDFSIINDSTGTGGVLLTRLIGSNVYRVSSSRTCGTTGTRNFGIAKYTTQSARTFRTTGIQVEVGLRATSYIATDDSTKTRAIDVLAVPLANVPGFNAAGYSLFMDQRMDTTLAASVVGVELSDLTASNRALLAATGGTVAAAQSSATAGNAGAATAGALGLNRVRYAASFSPNNLMIAGAGVAGTPDTSVTMPVSPTRLSFCSFNNTLPYNGFVFRGGLIPQVLTQAQLNALTAV
jgi:hypothetical protein